MRGFLPLLVKTQALLLTLFIDTVTVVWCDRSDAFFGAGFGPRFFLLSRIMICCGLGIEMYSAKQLHQILSTFFNFIYYLCLSALKTFYFMLNLSNAGDFDCLKI